MTDPVPGHEPGHALVTTGTVVGVRERSEAERALASVVAGLRRVAGQALDVADDLADGLRDTVLGRR